MQKIIIRTGLLLISLNSIVGLILSSYSLFNVLFSNVLLMIEVALAIYFNYKILKVGYKTISFISNLVIGIIAFILSIICPYKLIDNMYLVFVLILIFLQFFLMMIFNHFSNKN